MARQVQLRRGTTAEHSTFTGAVGEVTVDTDKDVAVVHDGVTAGGTPLLKAADLTAGTGISISGTEITNSDPDQTVVLTEGSNVTITGTYPNFTIASSDEFTGTVTSVGGTGTVNGLTLTGSVTSSGNLTLGGTFSATVSEISDLTATAAELNLLDGVTATTAEINYNDISTLGTSEASKVVTADANGNIKLSEEVQATAYLETVVALSGTTPTVDCDEGNTFTLTTSGNTTFTFDYSGVNLTTNDSYGFTLRVTAGGTHTLTWPASVDWPGGAAPDAPASGETDVFVFFTTDGGTNWYGFQAGDALA